MTDEEYGPETVVGRVFGFQAAEWEAISAEDRARIAAAQAEKLLSEIGQGEAVVGLAGHVQRLGDVVLALVEANKQRGDGYDEMTRFLTGSLGALKGELTALGRALEGNAFFGKALRRERGLLGLDDLDARKGAGKRWWLGLRRRR